VATSGVYSFDPTLGSLFLSAFGRLQVKRTELTPQHLADAKAEANFLQLSWSNEGVELWTQDLQTFAMVASQATYTVPAETVMVLDLYISPNGATGGQNRLIMPFSRTDYASLSNPAQEGFPTSFFYLRTVAQTLTFWPVPDNNATYQCSYWRYRQIQDADPRAGGNAELQVLFLDAYVAGLAHRLSRYYAPALEVQREKDADKAFQLAMKNNTENVAVYITPGLAGYFRS
jgi:hypothetical protein